MKHVIRVTVRLRRSDSRRPQDAEPVTMQAIAQHPQAEIVNIYGRGNYASVETTEEGLVNLKRDLGDVFSFVRTPEAKAFSGVIATGA